MSTYALLMAKATQKYFHENFDGAETANIQPSKSLPVYGRSWQCLYNCFIVIVTFFFLNIETV